MANSRFIQRICFRRKVRSLLGPKGFGCQLVPPRALFDCVSLYNAGHDFFAARTKAIKHNQYAPVSCGKTAGQMEHGHMRSADVMCAVSGWAARCLRRLPSFT